MLRGDAGRPPACSKGPVSAKTVGNLHRVLRKALGQAVRWQLVATNAAASAEPPRYRPAELAVVDAALARRILAATTETRLEAPVALALATGMRRGEILGLRWADLDSGLTVARVVRSLEVTSQGGVAFAPPKTARSGRAVALPEFLRPYLEAQRDRQARRKAGAGPPWAEHDLVVDAGRGGPWNPDTFSRAWGSFLKRRGLPRVRSDGVIGRRLADSSATGSFLPTMAGPPCGAPPRVEALLGVQPPDRCPTRVPDTRASG